MLRRYSRLNEDLVRIIIRVLLIVNEAGNVAGYKGDEIVSNLYQIHMLFFDCMSRFSSVH